MRHFSPRLTNLPPVLLWQHVLVFLFVSEWENYDWSYYWENKWVKWSKYLQQSEQCEHLIFPACYSPVSSHSQTNCLRSSDNQPLTNTNNSGNTSSNISDHFVKLYQNIICFTSKYFSILIFRCWSLADSQEGQNGRFALI